MEENIDKIEIFLRGQMCQEEEGVFKKSLETDTNLHSYAFIIAYMLRMQKTW